MDKLLATNSADNAFNRGVDSASGLMHRAVDSAADAAAPALQQMAAGAHSAIDKVASGTSHAAGTIAAKSSRLNHLQQQLTNNALSKMRLHPVLSLGIAVAGGALLSYWLSHRAAAKNAS